MQFEFAGLFVFPVVLQSSPAQPPGVSRDQRAKSTPLHVATRERGLLSCSGRNYLGCWLIPPDQTQEECPTQLVNREWEKAEEMTCSPVLRMAGERGGMTVRRYLLRIARVPDTGCIALGVRRAERAQARLLPPPPPLRSDPSSGRRGVPRLTLRQEVNSYC